MLNQKIQIYQANKAELWKIDEKHLLCLSYTLPTALHKRMYSETLLYESTESGEISNSKPVLQYTGEIDFKKVLNEYEKLHNSSG